MVHYDQSVQEEKIGGKRFEREPAPRLSTFVWDGGHWHLCSHAVEQVLKPTLVS